LVPPQTESARSINARKFSEGVFLGQGQTILASRFLFPGRVRPLIWREAFGVGRFESVRLLYEQAGLRTDGDKASTRIMQPAVVNGFARRSESIGKRLGFAQRPRWDTSLGEITALHWGGSLSEEALLRIAQVRGCAMADLGRPTGMMLAVAASPEKVQQMLDGEPLWIVGLQFTTTNLRIRGSLGNQSAWLDMLLPLACNQPLYRFRMRSTPLSSPPLRPFSPNNSGVKMWRGCPAAWFQPFRARHWITMRICAIFSAAR